MVLSGVVGLPHFSIYTVCAVIVLKADILLCYFYCYIL